MFSNPEQAEEIKDWLLKNYGREETIKDPFDRNKEITVKRIPFSFGFNGALKNRQRDVSTHIDMPVNTDEYDDKETSIEDEMEL
jgi:hypothetical protein